jgi:lysozyme family protein
MISLRMAFLEGLPTWNVFGAGWTARCEALQQYALDFEREGE